MSNTTDPAMMALALERGHTPLPQNRPDIDQLQYQKAMNYIRALQSVPPGGQPLFGEANGKPGYDGPLNITPKPIYYGDTLGFEGMTVPPGWTPPVAPKF